MKIVLASNNEKKIKELKALLGTDFEVLSLQDVGILEDIEEPFFTFEENAHAKAKYAFDKTKIATLAEDSGLVVPALDGAPGVFSARYAGDPKSDLRNTEKLLFELKPTMNRDAYYQTSICFINEAGTYYFTDICKGTIITEARGSGGFGYDPVFIPEGYENTFAELPETVKNSVSHRGKATRKFLEFILNPNCALEI